MIRQDLLPTPQDVQFWQENGYWKSGKIIDDAFLEELRNAMYRLWAAEFETGREPYGGPWRLGENKTAIRKMDQAHWANNTIRRLATNGTIGAICARLTGSPEIRLWHDQLLYKPGQGGKAAGAGGNVGWHQDFNYWQCATDNLLTAWVAFDDVTVENGCMMAVPGSHKWGFIGGDFFEQDMDKLTAAIKAKTGRDFQTVPLELKAGEVSFHHCLTIHGSGPNFTTKPRRSLVVHVMPDEARYIAGTSCDNHMNAILMRERGAKDGDRFKGDLWPALYSARETVGV